ncbi:hypothetical protein EKE94_01105 [Mesobaculum littorinae]|uniref:Uncharacterized protein n=1 Tax=Mesobaculum littorinae TaxID=2486419 RepID=A0A438AL10_9RHOB|nr:hypothetical protein [Mesobaculum littorinae]RVV99324.1 hypothetical protein EKE94_01105 [Mesobaculum littorinae]
MSGAGHAGAGLAPPLTQPHRFARRRPPRRPASGGELPEDAAQTVRRGAAARVEAPRRPTPRPRRWATAVLIACGTVIALGLAPLPSDLAHPQGAEATRLALILAAQLAPLLPLVLGLLRALGLRTGMRAAYVSALMVGTAGAVLTMSAYRLEPGIGEVLLLLGGIVSLAAAASFALLNRRGLASIGGGLAGLTLALCAIPAFWSLASVAEISVSARTIAGADPYCLARHSREAPVRSLAGLRAASFRAGLDSAAMDAGWQFHGLLLLDRPGGLEAWNWSPRAARFDRIENPERFLLRPLTACRPQPDYLGDLPLLPGPD